MLSSAFIVRTVQNTEAKLSVTREEHKLVNYQKEHENDFTFLTKL